jgi:fructose 5-dehydrogenase small subunit
MMMEPPKEPQQASSMTRRNAMVAGVTVFAGGLVGPARTNFALAAIQPDTQSRFMRMSGLLINHQLHQDVGARIVETAVNQYTDVPDMIDAIITIAERKQATAVEDFFADIPDGKSKDFAHWVISAWYSGCSSEKANATVFAYEEALTFKTASDVVPIPSYGSCEPNGWSQITVPLTNMPTF